LWLPSVNLREKWEKEAEKCIFEGKERGTKGGEERKEYWTNLLPSNSSSNRYKETD
jgi:hypothetical protein